MKFRFLLPIFVILFLSVNTGLSIKHCDELTQSIKQVDKIELHLHLGGAWPINFLKEIAEPGLFKQLSDFLDTIERGISYKDVFIVFDLISKIVNTDKKVEDGVVALCKQLSEDGVVYAEIRTGLKNLGSGIEGYLNAVLAGIKRGCAQAKLKVGIILSLRRDFTAQEVYNTILLLKKNRANVVGLDISGISTKGNTSGIFEVINLIKENNIPITLHLGESLEESAEQQMQELQILQPKRIGHGVHLSREAMQWIKEKKIPIELCLTSAEKVGMVKDIRMHPALELINQDHPVVICTDDPTIFKTCVSNECAKFAQITNCDIKQILKLQEVAQRSSFAYGVCI